MRWVVVGGTGMLGQDLVPMLRAGGHEVSALGSAECDVRDLETVRAAVTDADVVVNAAAWTAVDDAEEHEAAAFAVNAVGAHNVAVRAHELGARLVHVSTDYVFDGTSTTPYSTATPQNPRSAYGRTKAAGEWAVRAADPEALVVRTAWLYGAGGPNFCSTMLRLAEQKETWKVVDDQVGAPTWTRDLSRLIVDLVDRKAPGGYVHGTSAGSTTWFGLAQAVLESAGLDPRRISPCSTQEFPRPAPRPSFSVLADEGVWTEQPAWRDSVEEFIGTLGG